jgi:hypothetical protein
MPVSIIQAAMKIRKTMPVAKGQNTNKNPIVAPKMPAVKDHPHPFIAFLCVEDIIMVKIPSVIANIPNMRKSTHSVGPGHAQAKMPIVMAIIPLARTNHHGTDHHEADLN